LDKQTATIGEEWDDERECHWRDPKLIQDFLAPELRETRAELNYVKTELPQMKHRLIAAIKSSEENLTLMF
jgi:hypothetical protein